MSLTRAMLPNKASDIIHFDYLQSMFSLFSSSIDYLIMMSEDAHNVICLQNSLKCF